MKRILIVALLIGLIALPLMGVGTTKYQVRGQETALNSTDVDITFSPVAEKGVLLTSLDLETTFTITSNDLTYTLTLPAGASIHLDWPNISNVTSTKSGSTRVAVYADAN